MMENKAVVVVDECLVSSESLLDNTIEIYEDSDKPYVGQTFENLEDVKNFYSSYGG